MTVNKAIPVHRIRVILILTVISQAFLYPAWADYGFTGGSIGVIRASVRGVTCSIDLQCCPVSGQEDRIRIYMTASTSSHSFTAYEGVHKRRAVYRFSGIRRSRIVINGSTSEGTEHTIRVEPEKTYSIQSSAVFLWKTSSGKKAEGFAEYYRSTVSSQKIHVTGRKLIEIAEGKGGPAQEIPPVVTVSGTVDHTDEWDSHREEYNEKSGGKERAPEVFWDGEKFMVTADVVSAHEPDRVTVSAAGTGLSADLKPVEGVWEGELFDEQEAELLREKGVRELEFEFTVYADGQTARDTVTVALDDTDDYWLLHRKGQA